eukprot:m.426845 g.426845  ORF g.426845 m.426845 type:complete len:52 (+) comp16863_c0_seq14:893-1048(+)
MLRALSPILGAPSGCTLVQRMRCFFGDKTEYTQTCHGSVGSIAQPSLAMLP